AIPYANLENPQSLNLYAYVGNNPVTNVDKDGHLCFLGIGSCHNTPPPKPAGPPPPSTITAGPSATAAGRTVQIVQSSYDPVAGSGETTTETRTGDHPFRDNNPGDLKSGPFTAGQGAIGKDGSFAIFAASSAGGRALSSLLTGPAYSSLTVDQAIARFAPPSENDTSAYQGAVRSAAGVSGDTPLSALTGAQMQRVASAIADHEGFFGGGTSSVQTITFGIPH